MLSAQHTSTEVQPAADHALLYILNAEGRLGKPNFIHYQSQPSRSTKMFKRAEYNNNESEVLKVRFGQTTTVIDDRVIFIGGSELTEGFLPSNLLVLNSTSLDVNEQKATMPVSGHGAAPIRGSRILITFGIQAMAPQRTFATPVQEIDVNTMSVISFPQLKGEVPQQRYDHTTTKIDDSKIFIYGGINKDNMVLGDIFYIDLNLNSWNLISQPSNPIAGHSSILVNNYLISCFGINANAKVINDCKIFDISTSTFIQPIISEKPPIPRTLSSMVSFEDNKSDIYIFGGIDENNNGLNDLYKLDASKAPTLSWSPIIINAKTTNNKLIPSGRGSHSAFTSEHSHIMTIWGGISNGNQLADPNFYFFDIRGNIWVDESFYKGKVNHAQINLDDIEKPEPKKIVIIFGIIGAVVLILGFLGFFIIRKRKVLQKFQNKEINNDPYNQSNQFGSNTYLINDIESKQVQFKIIDEPESAPEPIPQPASTLPLISPSPSPSSPPPTNVEKESETSDNSQHNDSITSTTTSPKKMPFGKLPALTNTGLTSETQRMKRTHKRTSSVSLTSSELANIARSRNFTHHKSSLSTNNITSSTSLNNSSHNSRKSLSNFLDPVSEKGSKNRTSVNSIQWVGFNSSMVYDQEENREALHVRNLSSKQQRNSAKYKYSSDGEDDEYTINGDYIDTSPRVNNNFNRNIFDHEEVITTYDASQRKNGPQNYPARNNIQGPENNAAESNESISRESGVIDNFAHESLSNSYESSDTSNEEDKCSSMKKSKRSSKRISRVSFALKDEKIEFDENESSSTVSLTRRSQSSTSSSSTTPSIIEEEIDIEGDYYVLNNTPILNKSYDDDETSLSRF